MSGLGPMEGGNASALNITAAVVVKASPGRLFRVFVNTPGSGGNLTINDNTATGGTNTAANQIITIPAGNMTAGQTIVLEWPCANGIVVSSVTTGGGSFAVSYS